MLGLGGKTRVMQKEKSTMPSGNQKFILLRVYSLRISFESAGVIKWFAPDYFWLTFQSHSARGRDLISAVVCGSGQGVYKEGESAGTGTGRLGVWGMAFSLGMTCVPSQALQCRSAGHLAGVGERLPWLLQSLPRKLPAQQGGQVGHTRVRAHTRSWAWPVQPGQG